MLLRTGTIAALYSHDWSCLSNVSMCETNAAANAAGIIEWWSNWVTQILWISLEQGRFLIPFLNIISSLFLYPFLCGRRDEVWKKRLKWIIQTSQVHRTMIYWHELERGGPQTWCQFSFNTPHITVVCFMFGADKSLMILSELCS